jgi:alanine dehydrogenase
MAAVTRTADDTLKQKNRDGQVISGGRLVAKALKNESVDTIFTLCGGHIIDIYDGCVDEGIRVIDVRHEQRRQREHVAEALKKTDIVISTALVPGRKAPILVTREMLAGMKPGSVIVDLAVEQGGNIEGSTLGEIVTTDNGVTIFGYANMPSRIAVDASALYAKNVFAFLGLIVKDQTLTIDTADEIVKSTLLTSDGVVVNPSFMPVLAMAAGD